MDKAQRLAWCKGKIVELLRDHQGIVNADGSVNADAYYAAVAAGNLDAETRLRVMELALLGAGAFDAYTVTAGE